MLEVSLNPYRAVLREHVGLAHEAQVVEIPVPEGSSPSFFLRDENTGRVHFVQRSLVNAGLGFLSIRIDPGQSYSFVFAEASELQAEPGTGISSGAENDAWFVRSATWEIELAPGSDEARTDERL